MLHFEVSGVGGGGSKEKREAISFTLPYLSLPNLG